MNLANLSAAPGEKPKHTSMVSFTRNIIKNEGVGSLYKGLSAGITRQVCCVICICNTRPVLVHTLFPVTAFACNFVLLHAFLLRNMRTYNSLHPEHPTSDA